MSYIHFRYPSTRRLRCLGLEEDDARILVQEMRNADNHIVAYQVMDYANMILNGYGVGRLSVPEWQNGFYGHIGALYVQRGDLNELLPTIIFHPASRSFLIDSPSEFAQKLNTDEGKEDVRTESEATVSKGAQSCNAD